MTVSAPINRSSPVPATALIVAMVATAVMGIVGSHLATWIFVVAAGLVVAEAALASLRWPRAALVGVVLSPILDRYLVPGLLAPDAETVAHLLSEALLVAVGVALVAQAARRSSLRAAVNHPTVRLALVFVVLAAISAAVNAVPAGQALAGIGFTLDAVALFVLARIVRFDSRGALMAINVMVGLALGAAVVAIAQAVLSPHLLGLPALQGRYGEVYRLAAFFGDPNVFAAFLSASIPFALFGATGLWTARGRRLALGGGFILVLALWLSFSRGGWLGAFAGFAIASVLLDRRALRVGLVVVPVALLVALVMPRDLLCRECDARPDLVGSTVGRVATVGSGKDLRTSLAANAVPIMVDHPLVGVGPGRYGGAAADLFGTPVYAAYGTDRLFVNPSQRTVDNFWLHLAVESGLLGLLAYMGMIGAALRPIMRSVRTAAWGRRVALAGISAAVIGLSINGVTTMLLEANSVAFLFWFLLGIGSQLAGSELPADRDLPQGTQNQPNVEPE